MQGSSRQLHGRVRGRCSALHRRTCLRRSGCSGTGTGADHCLYLRAWHHAWRHGCMHHVWQHACMHPGRLASPSRSHTSKLHCSAGAAQTGPHAAPNIHRHKPPQGRRDECRGNTTRWRNAAFTHRPGPPAPPPVAEIVRAMVLGPLALLGAMRTLCQHRNTPASTASRNAPAGKCDRVPRVSRPGVLGCRSAAIEQASGTQRRGAEAGPLPQHRHVPRAKPAAVAVRARAHKRRPRRAPRLVRGGRARERGRGGVGVGVEHRLLQELMV